MKIKIRSKKGVSSYLGWVLLMAFMVSLSTFMYSFMSEQVKSHTEQINYRADENLCESTSITINQKCQSESLLIMNITNTNKMAVAGFKIQLFDIYEEPISSSINITIKPSEQKEIKILKPGTLLQVEMIPKIINQERDIYCLASKVIITPIEMC